MTLRRNGIYFVSLLLSFCLSYWASVRVTVINPDAICYLQSAETMAAGLKMAMQLCEQAHWPFYSLIIHFIHSLTSISTINSAYLLNGIFSALSVLAFIRIAQFFKDRISVMVFAAFVILMAHDFNVLRESIIRDHGFWAFYLISILSLLHFVRKPCGFYAVGWSLSLVIATLFRIEGIFFLVVLPFVAVISTAKWLRAFLMLNSLTLLMVIFCCFWLIKHPDLSALPLSRFAELKFQLINGLSTINQHFQANAQAIQEHVLNKYSAHDSLLIFFIALMGWYIVYIVKSVSLLNAILVVFAWVKKLLLPEKKLTRILWAYVLINVVITSVFLVEFDFLSKRYLLALALTLLIWVPFALNYLYEQEHKFILIIVLILMSATAFGNVFNSSISKRYIHDAGNWLHQNVPQEAALYSNDYQVMYYSQHFGNTIFVSAKEFLAPKMLAEKQLAHYDYVALRTFKKDRQHTLQLKTQLGLPVQVFSNKRGDEVAIYKLK